MEKRQYAMVIEKDDKGWYVGSVPAVPGCHTQARSLDELMERMQEALELCLEAEGAAGQALPRLTFVGVQQLETNV